MHLPEVLFLDEPTVGVDPRARADLWRIVGELYATGRTVVPTTHHLDGAEALRRFTRRGRARGLPPHRALLPHYVPQGHRPTRAVPEEP
ncbi:hypothetical protein ACH4TP_12715 [Streptomyces sp. NPDC021012]|uniref:hypothetical protein n=1 Tax=Streptomyces sp. NPDC021012 TaxID=3365107 RepID=UPI0037A868CB